MCSEYGYVVRGGGLCFLGRGGVGGGVYYYYDYKTWFMFWCTVVRTERSKGTCSFSCTFVGGRTAEAPRIIMWGMGWNDDYAGGFVMLSS